MKEHPIIFCNDMISAIRADEKTMTRRIVKPQPVYVNGLWLWENTAWDEWNAQVSDLSPLDISPFRVGNRLWVRERWATEKCFDKVPPSRLPRSAKIWYCADGSIPEWCGRKRSRLFMPRWASRITLEITGVKVERLQEISEEDAIKEGVGHGFQMNAGWPDYQHINNDGICELTQDTAQMSFASLWDSLNAVREGYSWQDNPFVWCITFKRIN